MNSERRGLVVVVAVLLVSAVLGGIYGPNVRATTASADDYQTAVRDFTRVLNVVQNNYADPVDVIVKVDERSTDGLTTSEVADMLKGPKGTVVKITVSREGYSEQLVFTVTRDEIPRHSVDIAFMLKPGVGYIRLSGFNETTDREIAEALKQLNATALDGLILDMRGNPGGLLNEAVAVGDMFLDKNQLIVSHHGRTSPERRYYAVRGNQGVTVPLVILVNNNS